MTVLEIIFIAAGLLVGALVGALVSRKMGGVDLKQAQEKADNLLKEAALEVKDKAYKAKTQLEEELKEQRKELQGLEKRLGDRQDSLEKKYEALQRNEEENRKLERDLRQKEEGIKKLEGERQALLEEEKKQLEIVSGLSKEEAKKQLMDQMLSEAKHEAAKRAQVIEEEARDQAEMKAKKIISNSIERLAGEWVHEATVSTLQLPSDDMKGRIIGREGRNIRALEAITGVDFIVDDTPGTVVLSCHNPIRREVARRAMEKLLADGRIHPARIEELVAKEEKEVDKLIREAGQQALFELDIHGVHPEIVKLLGMLKYRYSYAQNVLRHSVEVGFLCGMMGGELGLNVKVARRAGLLHDIGKALTHEVEGSHAVIGGEMCKKYGESAEVTHAVWAHHEDLPQETILDHLVDAADALSGARPGARMESTETYVKRIEDLEKLATSFAPVQKAYAIQAGREIRVMVDTQKVTDEEAHVLCKEMAKKIQSELTYPGQIKVTVIRELRATDYAR